MLSGVGEFAKKASTASQKSIQDTVASITKDSGKATLSQRESASLTAKAWKSAFSEVRAAAPEAFDAIEKLTDRIENAAKKVATTSAKVIGGGLVATAAGVAKLTQSVVSNYGEFQQMVGGAELLYGKAFGTVEKNAKSAFKTVQMSSTDYLRQANMYATGLKTSLGGDEEAAAQLAHKIIKAQADVVAATGQSREMVENAFMGIMRNNFVMLDNLQLGITPTKTGMEDLIKTVNRWHRENGRATAYEMGNLADMQSALVDYIEMQKLSGYAGMEASKTIQGSFASVKAAFQNLVTGLGDPAADIGQLIDDVIEQGKGLFENNLLPTIKQALKGISSAVKEVSPIVAKELPGIVEEVAPAAITAITEVVTAMSHALPKLMPILIDQGEKLLDSLFDGFTRNMDLIITAGGRVLDMLVQGIDRAAKKLIAKAPELISRFAQSVRKSSTLSKIAFVAFGKMFVDLGKKAKTAYDIISKVKQVGPQLATTLKTISSSSTGIMAVLSNPYFLGAAAAIAAIGGAVYIAYKQVKKAAEETYGLTDAQKLAIEQTQEQYDSMQDMLRAREDSRKSINAEYGELSKLKDELDNLILSNGQVKHGYEDRADFIMTTLANALGIEYDDVGDLIGQYKTLSGEIDDLIAKKRGEAALAAGEEDYRTALRERDDQAASVSELRKQVADAQEKYRTAVETDEKTYAFWEDKVGAVGAGFLTAGTRYAVATAKNSLDELTTQLAQASETYRQTLDTIEGYEDLSTAIFNGEGIAEASDKFLANFRDTNNATLEELVAQRDRLQSEYKTAIEMQAEGLVQYTDEQLTAMANLAAEAQRMVDDKTAEQTRLRKAEREEAYAEEQTAARTNGTKVSEEYGGGITDGVSSVDTATSNVFKAANDPLANLPGLTHGYGVDIGHSLASGMQDPQSLQHVVSAATGMAAKIRSILHFSKPDEGPLADFDTYAPDMMQLFAQGIRDNTGMVQREIESAFTLPDVETYTSSATGYVPKNVSEKNNTVDQLLGVVTHYLPQLANMKVVMDSGAEVGALAPGMDADFGRRLAHAERGNA